MRPTPKFLQNTSNVCGPDKRVHSVGVRLSCFYFVFFVLRLPSVFNDWSPVNEVDANLNI